MFFKNNLVLLKKIYFHKWFLTIIQYKNSVLLLRLRFHTPINTNVGWTPVGRKKSKNFRMSLWKSNKVFICNIFRNKSVEIPELLLISHKLELIFLFLWHYISNNKVKSIHSSFLTNILPLVCFFLKTLIEDYLIWAGWLKELVLKYCF